MVTKNVKSLIKTYPKHLKVDKVLEALGDDFYHDGFQDMDEEEESAVAAGDGGAPSESSDDSVESDNDEPVGLTAVAVDANDEPVGITAVAGDSTEAPVDEIGSTSTEILPLSDKQAEAVQQMRSSISELESAREALRAMGSLRSVQVLEMELAKERRRLRALSKEVPAVAETFFRFRAAEEQDALAQQRFLNCGRKKTRSSDSNRRSRCRSRGVKASKKTNIGQGSHQGLHACSQNLHFRSIGRWHGGWRRR